MPILVPVTEAYYGKPKQLVAVEKDVAKIKEWIDYEYALDGAKKKNIVDINNTKECRNIENAFKEAFKLGDCNIVFYGNWLNVKINANEDGEIDEDTKFPIEAKFFPPNAFTLPQVLLTVKHKALGNEFNPNDIKATIYIDKAFIYCFNINPKEIIATILHELGHNFDHSWFHLFSTILPDILSLDLDNENWLIKHIKDLAMGSILMPLIRMIYRDGFKAIETIKSKMPAPVNAFISSVLMGYNYTKEMVKYITYMTGKKLPDFKSAITKTLSPRSIFGYASEKYADSFATAYGYGPEIASSMAKISRGVTQGMGGTFNPRNIPVMNVMYDMLKTTMSIPFAFSDPHPKYITRVYSQLKKLRRELNDPDIPKELKKEMASQIVELEKLCDSMTEIRMQEETGMFFSAIMNKLSKDVFKGIDDPREVLELIWRHEA